MALSKKQKDEIIRLIASIASYGKVISTTKDEADSQFEDILELCRLHSGKISLKKYIEDAPHPVIKQFRISNLIDK